jgi:hypothetical protein
VDEILASTREDLENRNRLVAEQYTPLIRFLEDLGTPLPAGLKTAVDFVIHVDLIKQFESDETNLERLTALLDEATHRKVQVWDDQLQHAVSKKLERVVEKLKEVPGDGEFAEHAARLGGIIRTLPIDPNLWRVRNTYWKMLHSTLPKYRDKAAKGDETAALWVRHFLALGDHLNFARKYLQME